MQCPNCHRDAVDAGVFCNHCGIRLPVLCVHCRAENPPESRFCYRCGNSISVTNTPTPTRETRIRDIGADLKTLGHDVAAYSAPRIKSGSASTARTAKRVGIFASRHAKATAVATTPHIKALAQRFKPRQPEPPPEASTGYVADHATHGDLPQEPEQHSLNSSGSAITCPRCHQVSEPGSLFCFSCGLPLDEQAMPVRPRTTSDGQPAGFWIRFGAWLIDAVILATLQIVLIAVWPGLSEYFTSDDFGHPVDLLVFILDVLYFTLGVAIWSTTIGKRLLGMYVHRPDGARVGVGRALARYFAGILSFLIFFIGYLMVGLRSDKRGLHDLICDTIVVRK